MEVKYTFMILQKQTQVQVMSRLILYGSQPITMVTKLKILQATGNCLLQSYLTSDESNDLL